MQIREATSADFTAIHRVRMSVRENRLSDPARIGPDDYREYLERRGRGWVAESGAGILGFAVGDATDGSIWALFVDPACEGHGVGRALHDRMVDWLFQRGHAELRLGTDPGTRAERFYRAAGWEYSGPAENGEARFRLRRERWMARAGSAGRTDQPD